MAAKKKGAGGRPKRLTEELKAEFLERVADKQSVAAIGRLEHFPDATNIHKELNRDPEFRHKYEASKLSMAERFGEEIVEISDNEDGDTQRDRLRIDTRKWLMSKLLPKKYGDKLDVETTHKGAIKVTIGGDA